MTESTAFGRERNDSFLRAQSACQNLVIFSLKLIDAGEALRVRAMFTEDGAHTLNGEVFAGPALTKFFETRQAMVGRRTLHSISNLAFSLLTENHAEISSSCVVYLLSLEDEQQRRIPRGIVSFRDSFVRDETGEWLFSRREATIIAGER